MLMNLATPIIIVHPKEDFRSLLRDMLIKHGFFHLIEASSSEELHALLKQNVNERFFLVQSHLMDEIAMEAIIKNENFIVFAQPDDNRAIFLSTRLGVKRIISFPFSSQYLVEKIKEVSQ